MSIISSLTRRYQKKTGRSWPGHAYFPIDSPGSFKPLKAKDVASIESQMGDLTVSEDEVVPAKRRRRRVRGRGVFSILGDQQEGL